MDATRSTGPALVALALALGSGEAAMAYEEPEYEVVLEADAFEVRRYRPCLVAETEVTGSLGSSGSAAFRILAGFISGANEGRRKVAMTAPVTSRPDGPSEAGGERIAMTAPVVQEPDAGGEADAWVYRFIMPRGYSLDTLPRPTDPRVRIREVPGRELAVRRFSGFWSEANFDENEARLREALAGRGLEPVGAAIYARYDPPWKPWFLRRNEVWLELRAAPEG